LAKKLGFYGVKPDDHWFGDRGTLRGYHVKDGLYAAWQSYCPDPPPESKESKESKAPGRDRVDLGLLGHNQGEEDNGKTPGPKRVKL
jgi:hypothetical protein